VSFPPRRNETFGQVEGDHQGILRRRREHLPGKAQQADPIVSPVSPAPFDHRADPFFRVLHGIHSVDGNGHHLWLRPLREPEFCSSYKESLRFETEKVDEIVPGPALQSTFALRRKTHTEGIR
jgi:hypothetical protein